MLLIIIACLIGAITSERPNFEQRREGIIDTLDTSDENEINVDQSEKNDKFRGSLTFAQDEYEEDDGSYRGKWIDTIPGRPNIDYPAYENIPKTSFSCKGRRPSGYYADTETNCQVFHICVADNHKISFLCPNGSIFNQKVLVCDWWYDVECQQTDDIITYSEKIVKNEAFNANQEYAFENYAIEGEYDLSLASSGGNQNPQTSSKDKDEKVFKSDVKEIRNKDTLRRKIDKN